MRRMHILSGLVVVCIVGVGGALLPGMGHTQDAMEFAPAPMTVAPGFEVTVAAAPPLVKHPLMAGFDHRGRLYIAESAGDNLRREDLEKQLPNFVRRLEDVDGDGVFDRSTIFADNLTLPQGALWHDGALYVAAPPNIWKFEDRDDDGVAEHRTALVDRFGYTGNAASIHGCFLGPAGRIYWCDGRHGHEVHDEQGQLISEGTAARIFSCRTDGSDFRVHCGGGMDNPVEVDFMPTGEMLGTVNLFYRQRGDCLVHWLHGGAYPRYDQKCIEEFPRTGELLKEVHNLGHVAVSGMTRLRAPLGALGALQAGAADQQGSTHWMLTEFNSHRIMHATLRRKGSTFAAEVRELLASSSADFHPTDVLEDADGSLLVIDTGGWFRIGCPTSQIAKPNILGAIYRIRPQASTAGNTDPSAADPRGLTLNWALPDPATLSAFHVEMAGRLADQRPAVVERATSLLAQGGAPAATALVAWRPTPVQHQLRKVWALARNQSPAARTALIELLRSSEWEVQAAAAMSCGLLGETEAIQELTPLLTSEQPALRRSAATALGRLKASAATPQLLAALEFDNDRSLRHAIIYALMEIGNVQRLREALSSSNSKVRRGALLALDQGSASQLKLEDVLPLTNDEDLALRGTALEVIASRGQWSEAARGQLFELLEQEASWSEPTRAGVQGLLAAVQEHADDTAWVTLRDAVATAIKKRPDDDARLLLEYVASLAADARWAPAVARGLERPNVRSAAIAAATVHGAKPEILERLMRLTGESSSVENRIAAWMAWTTSTPTAMPVRGYQFLTEQLRGDDPTLRLSAARALAAARLSDGQALRLAEIAKSAGPLELPTLLGVWQGRKQPQLGLAIVAALESAPGTASLSLDQLDALFVNFPTEVRAAAAPLREQRVAEAKQRGQALARHVDAAEGNVDRGRRVFFSRDVGCAACHRVSGVGGNVGPDLTAIGQRRSKRDLLEAILFPSASQARGFESYLVRLSDGRQVAGLILGESPHELQLRTADQRTLRVNRRLVEAMKPSAISVMPAGLEKTMNETQLRDLIAYLQTLKAEQTTSR